MISTKKKISFNLVLKFILFNGRLCAYKFGRTTKNTQTIKSLSIDIVYEVSIIYTLHKYILNSEIEVLVTPVGQRKVQEILAWVVVHSFTF